MAAFDPKRSFRSSCFIARLVRYSRTNMRCRHHWLYFSVHQCSPQPFKRAETEAAKPPSAEQHLRHVDSNADYKRVRSTKLTKLAEAIPEEDKTKNQRLYDI